MVNYPIIIEGLVYAQIRFRYDILMKVLLVLQLVKLLLRIIVCLYCKLRIDGFCEGFPLTKRILYF